MENNKEIKVGDIVRCWDFPPKVDGGNDCYKVGRVLNIIYPVMEISVMEDIWRGSPYKGIKAKSVSVFLPGMLRTADWEDRIQIL